jgi:hypothetical protein
MKQEYRSRERERQKDRQSDRNNRKTENWKTDRFDPKCRP